MSYGSNSMVSSPVQQWALVEDDAIDISFLARQHRRRLSKTVQLALTAYHQCNPDSEPLRTVFASRYGEYTRTFGILEDIAQGSASSPAAFSVSVHNTPSAIVGIATASQAPSSTVSSNASTVEAGFLEAVLQQGDPGSGEIIFIYVDEPLPELYRAFRRPQETACALGLRLGDRGGQDLRLAWRAKTGTRTRYAHGLPEAGFEIVRLLNNGTGRWTNSDGRLEWEWAVEQR